MVLYQKRNINRTVYNLGECGGFGDELDVDVIQEYAYEMPKRGLSVAFS